MFKNIYLISVENPVVVEDRHPAAVEIPPVVDEMQYIDEDEDGISYGDDSDRPEGKGLEIHDNMTYLEEEDDIYVEDDVDADGVLAPDGVIGGIPDDALVPDAIGNDAMVQDDVAGVGDPDENEDGDGVGAPDEDADEDGVGAPDEDADEDGVGAPVNGHFPDIPEFNIEDDDEQVEGNGIISTLNNNSNKKNSFLQLFKHNIFKIFFGVVIMIIILFFPLISQITIIKIFFPSCQNSGY